MSGKSSPLQPEEAIECVRTTVREQIIGPLLRQINGPIAEILETNGTAVTFKLFESADEYRDEVFAAEADTEKPDEPEEPEASVNPNRDDSEVATEYQEGSAELAVWIFGPERSTEPSAVYRLLGSVLSTRGTAIVVTEAPWPGKILLKDEFGEYSSEETEAALVRAGFSDITTIIDGPFFRLWRAERCEGDFYKILIEAEDLLDEGDWENAEKRLNGITEPLRTTVVVREYALLVAACHDLAGRPKQCLEALSEALTLDPHCARAMCGLGRIAALQGDLRTAAEFFESALRCSPALVAALHGKAVVAEAQGDIETAYSSMLMASDLRPGSEELLAEAARLGNAAGKLDDVGRFLKHRLETTSLRPAESDFAEDATQNAHTT